MQAEQFVGNFMLTGSLVKFKTSSFK